MKATQTILVGFVLVMLGVLVGFFLNQEFSQARTAEAAGSYSVLHVDVIENKFWRMNNRTGEITTCRENGGRLVCTEQATLVNPNTYPHASTADRIDPKFDRIMFFFDRFLDTAFKDSESKISAQPASEKR